MAKDNLTEIQRLKNTKVLWTGFDAVTESHIMIFETPEKPTVLLLSDNGVTVEVDSDHYIGEMLKEELSRAEQIIELNNLFGKKSAETPVEAQAEPDPRPMQEEVPQPQENQDGHQ